MGHCILVVLVIVAHPTVTGGGMYTGQHDGVRLEALEMSLPYSSSSPADSAVKVQECVERRNSHAPPAGPGPASA